LKGIEGCEEQGQFGVAFDAPELFFGTQQSRRAPANPHVAIAPPLDAGDERGHPSLEVS
jgi:hypothetical protein